MNSISLKLDDKDIELLIEKYKTCLVDNKNPYIKAFIKTPDETTISIYTTNKVLIQGANAHIYGASFINKNQREAGSDEVGTGDYFGPICVCAAIVEEKDFDLLNDLRIIDSKQMTDEKILEVGEILRNNLKHSLLILDNKTYNKAHKTNNLNQIKAKLHNQAYINLKNKGYKIPSAAYIDQFEPEDAYYRHLLNEKEVYHQLFFDIKGESKHPSIAASSVIARYAFLKSMQSMESKYNFKFPLGSREHVDTKAYEFVLKYGFEKLDEVAKIHFKNTERVLEMFRK